MWKSSRFFGAVFRSPASVVIPLQQRFAATQAPVNLAYVEMDDPHHRPPDGSTKTPLIIVHGLFGSTQNWRSVGKSLNARLKRKVILADLRNHGDSPHTDVMTFSAMAADIGELVKNVNPSNDRAILLGHSLGGLVCTYFALTKPKRVEKLIIEDVTPRSYYGSESSTAWAYISHMKGSRWTSSKLMEARQEVNEQLAKTIQNKDIRQFLLMNLVEKNGKIAWRLNLNVLDVSKDQLAIFPQERLLGYQYDGPTLVIRGGNSDYVRTTDAGVFGSFFPRWKMHTIEGAGHWVHSEQPARFIDCVVEFVNQS